jgi:hypothetical protein
MQSSKKQPFVDAKGNKIPKIQKKYHLEKWKWKKGCPTPNVNGLGGRPKKTEIGALTREILAEEHPKTGRTELERLIRQMLRRAHQGSFRHAEVLLAYGFGKPLAVQQNVNLNVDDLELSIEEVNAKLGEMYSQMGIPRPVWTAAGRTSDITAVRTEIRELLEKREQAKRPKALPVEGTGTIQ